MTARNKSASQRSGILTDERPSESATSSRVRRSGDIPRWKWGAAAVAVIAAVVAAVLLTPAAGSYGSATAKVLAEASGPPLQAKLSAEANELAAAANALSRWQAAAASIGALTGILALLSAIAAAIYAKNAATESKRNADIARDSLIASERAWLNVNVIPLGALQFHPAGTVDILIGVEITNVGKTPALNVHTHVEMSLNYQQIPNLLKELASKQRHVNTKWSRLLLPAQSYVRRWGAGTELQHDDTGILPVIYGVVTYQLIRDGSLHQTAFAVMLSKRDPAGDSTSLFMREKYVAATDIVIEETTGGFAD